MKLIQYEMTDRTHYVTTMARPSYRVVAGTIEHEVTFQAFMTLDELASLMKGSGPVEVSVTVNGHPDDLEGLMKGLQAAIKEQVTR